MIWDNSLSKPTVQLYSQLKSLQFRAGSAGSNAALSLFPMSMTHWCPVPASVFPSFRPKTLPPAPLWRTSDPAYIWHTVVAQTPEFEWGLLVRPALLPIALLFKAEYQPFPKFPADQPHRSDGHPISSPKMKAQAQRINKHVTAQKVSRQCSLSSCWQEWPLMTTGTQRLSLTLCDICVAL